MAPLDEGSVCFASGVTAFPPGFAGAPEGAEGNSTHGPSAPLVIICHGQEISSDFCSHLGFQRHSGRGGWRYVSVTSLRLMLVMEAK